MNLCSFVYSDVQVPINGLDGRDSAPTQHSFFSRV